jgi:pilus assembly protein CpaE
MKIVLLSTNKETLQALGAALQSRTNTVAAIEGGIARLRGLADHDSPDVVVIDAPYFDPGDLSHVEQATTRHPAMAVMLLCANVTPDFLMQAMRAGVREVLPAPLDPAQVQAAVARVAAKLPGVAARHAGKVVAFMNCKGGAGTTFLATNFGYQLAESRNVLLIDLDLQFGDALSFVHDGRAMSTVATVARDIARLDGSFLAASAVKVTPTFSILAAPEEPAQALEVKAEHIDAILNVAVTQYDFVLLDLGRTLDAVTVQALDRADRIYPVLQASLPYLRNAKKLFTAYRALGYENDKVECIVNRFDRRGEIGLEQIAKLLGPVRMHTVPNSFKAVHDAINQGYPLAELARSNAVTKILSGIVQALSPQQQENRGLFGRILGRT